MGERLMMVIETSIGICHDVSTRRGALPSAFHDSIMQAPKPPWAIS